MNVIPPTRILVGRDERRREDGNGDSDENGNNNNIDDASNKRTFKEMAAIVNEDAEDRGRCRAKARRVRAFQTAADPLLDYIDATSDDAQPCEKYCLPKDVVAAALQQKGCRSNAYST